MVAMREEPRSGHTTPEPTRRKCGATMRRVSCSSESLVSANTIHDSWAPVSIALTSIRRTIPSAPGAVERTGIGRHPHRFHRRRGQAAHDGEDETNHKASGGRQYPSLDSGEGSP